MEELQQHQGEWFFLHELNVDKVFSTIQRADYLILYYVNVPAKLLIVLLRQSARSI